MGKGLLFILLAALVGLARGQLSCPDNLFCAGGQFRCLTAGEICNGINDCSFTTVDEGNTTGLPTTIGTLDCGMNVFDCGAGATTPTVALSALCDGVNDCGNFADEIHSICQDRCLPPANGGCDALNRVCQNNALDSECGDCLPGFITTNDPTEPCAPIIFIQFDEVTYSATEGDDPSVEVCVSVVNPGDLDVNDTFDITIVAETAGADTAEGNGEDYEGVSVDVTITSTATQHCITVNINDDDIVETVEQFRVRVTEQVVVVQPLVSDIVPVFILENDIAEFNFTLTSAVVPEDIVMTTFTVLFVNEVSLGVSLVINVIVDIGVAGSTAINGLSDDYSTSSATQTFTFDNRASGSLAGEPGDPDNSTVFIFDDLLIEPTETIIFSARLESPTLGFDVNTRTMLVVKSSTIDIQNNDALTVSIEQTSYSVDESDGSVEVCVVVEAGEIALNGPSLSVTLSSSDGTAVDPDDYSDISQVFSFNPSATVGDRQCVNITIIDDISSEGNEQLNLTLSTTTPLLIKFGTDSATVEIADNEVHFALRSTTLVVEENENFVPIVVELTQGGPTTRRIALHFLTSNISATADDCGGIECFLSVPIGSPNGSSHVCTLNVTVCHIMAGQEPFVVSVSALEDNNVVFESGVAHEIFTCVLTSVNPAAQFGPDTAIVTIINDGSNSSFSLLEEKIAKECITEENYEEILNLLNTIVAEAGILEQTECNIAIVSEILSRIAILVTRPDVVVSNSAAIATVQIVDNIEEWPAEVVQEENNEIIQSFETIVTSLVEQENFTNITVVTEDVAFVGERVSVEDLRINGRSFSSATSVKGGDIQMNGRSYSSSRRVKGILDPMTGNEATDTLDEDEIVAVFLDPELFQEFDEGDAAIAFTLYDNPDNLFPVQSTFRDRQEESEEVTNIGTAVIGILVPEKENTQDLPQPVEIQQRINPPENGNITNVTCVFWNFTLNGTDGGWSEVGCRTMRDCSNPDITVCQCDHLTNFAALVDICSRTGCSPLPSGLALALDIISIIGVSLSLAGIVATVITLLAFKKLRGRDATKFHVQLCAALFAMLLVFVIGIDRTEVYGGCVAVSALIHYFTLVAVMWMGAEAILMFQKLVLIFTKIRSSHIIGASIVCWTLPIVPVIIPLAIDRDFMVTYHKVHGLNHCLDFCFIGDTAVLFGAFLGPIFTILLFNCVIFGVVISVLIRNQCCSNVRRNEKIDLKTAVRFIVSIIGVMSLFGLTWLFGAFTVTGATLVFQVLFAVFNSLQGFFIFLFYCVINQDARDLWKETLTCARYKGVSNTYTSNKLSGTGNIPRHNPRILSTDTSSTPHKINLTHQEEVSGSSTHQHSERDHNRETTFDSQVLTNPAILPVEEHDSSHESSPANEVSDLAKHYL